MKHRIPTQRRSDQALSAVTPQAWRTAMQPKAVRQHQWGIPFILGAAYLLILLLVVL